MLLRLREVGQMQSRRKAKLAVVFATLELTPSLTPALQPGCSLWAHVQAGFLPSMVCNRFVLLCCQQNVWLRFGHC